MIVFDGRTYARQKEEELKLQVEELKKKGITPKLASILVGNNPASILYTSLKKKAAERIGVEMEVLEFDEGIKIEALTFRIDKLNTDPTIHGIMVQLPLPEGIKDHESGIRNAIFPTKDVDGLRDDSKFVPATVKGILSILDYALKHVRLFLGSTLKVAVFGAEGMVGKPLVRELRNRGYEVSEIDISTKKDEPIIMNSDILISATGVPNLIKGNMVKEGGVVIDVGSPQADIEFDSVSKKASFITPVPGGVGPVTIVSLLENLVSAAQAGG